MVKNASWAYTVGPGTDAMTATEAFIYCSCTQCCHAFQLYAVFSLSTSHLSFA